MKTPTRIRSSKISDGWNHGSQKAVPYPQLFTKLKKVIPWDQLTLEQLAWNMGVLDELKPHSDDYIVEKGSWSNGFRETNLSDIVRKLKINTMIFTGVAEPIAIYGTFLGAWDEGLETVMVARVTESHYLRFD